MRVIYFIILLMLLAAIGIFAVQNRETITVQYLDRSVSCPLALLIGIVYLLGMVSGWTVVGFLQRSLQRVSEQPRDPTKRSVTGDEMNHQEEHHQHHRKEREQKKEVRKEHEHEEERRQGNIHPAWYLALGLVLTMVATLTWTVLYSGSF